MSKGSCCGNRISTSWEDVGQKAVVDKNLSMLKRQKIKKSKLIVIANLLLIFFKSFEDSLKI